MHVLSAPGHELLARDDGARAGARGRLHATPQPHRSSAWTWRPASSRPTARSRADRTRRDPPPERGPISDFGQRFPRIGAMGPQHTPALVHNALKPQATARRRAFRKATHRFAPPAARKHKHLPRARSRTTTRDFVKHYSCTVGVRGFGTISPSASRRQPPPRITSRRRAPGHPAARAGRRLSRPLGRSPLSAGEWSPLGVLGPPRPP